MGRRGHQGGSWHRFCVLDVGKRHLEHLTRRFARCSRMTCNEVHQVLLADSRFGQVALFLFKEAFSFGKTTLKLNHVVKDLLQSGSNNERRPEISLLNLLDFTNPIQDKYAIYAIAGSA